MNNAASEPEVLEAEWDRAQVEALLNDLRQGAEVQHVQVRTREEVGSTDTTTTLDDAQRAFASENAKAIQIRYQFDGQSWCDTLMIQPQSIRIIRTRLPESH